MTPTVSVLMAAYNGADLLPATIESVLAQSFDDWELVVVDDCSTDNTLAVLHGYDDPRIRVIAAETNQGPVHTRNRAFAETRGRYIAALDQDDLCHPDRFWRQVAWLDSHPDTVLVSCAVNFLQDGHIRSAHLTRRLTPELIDWLMLIRNPLAWSSVMFRASAARHLDPFERPELRYAEDFDFYQRLRTHGEFAQIDDELLTYRCHPGGASQKHGDMMAVNARRVIEEAHVQLCGHASSEASALLLEHVMQRRPVPDLETLETLFEVIERLQEGFVARRPVSQAGRERIAHEISVLWWETCRTAVRSGALPLRKTMAATPARIEAGIGRSADLIMSGLIGRVRALVA